ncbi:MAG: DNA polymerase IV [Clostridiales bacterium]|jgi:DNA polymerase-4|nr:DNA polymerase IV [Clostridiales bacterium]
MKERLILHCDLNNFYASVEIKNDPALGGGPLAVAGSVEKRHGVILAKNDAAKRLGVKTGESVLEALKKAPGLKIVPPHFDEYMRYSELAFRVYNDYTPLVEPFGADECWLDCTGSQRLFGSGPTIADAVRGRIKRELGLTISVGVSFNKVFAKLGSDLKKPDAVTVIGRDDFRRIVWPLPAGDLFMVGKKTAEKLNKINITTIGALAAADERILKAHLGVNGVKLKRNALGLDDEPVREAVKLRDAVSVGHGMTAVKDITAYGDAETLVYFLCERIAARLGKKRLTASGIRIDLRSAALKHTTRQAVLSAPVSAAADLAREANALLRAIWPEEPPLRTVTVSTYRLQEAGASVQLSFFDAPPGARKSDRLQDALLSIREKYGTAAIVRADLIERDFIYDKDEGEDFLPFKR